MNIFQDFRSIGECLKTNKQTKKPPQRPKARGKCISLHTQHCGERKSGGACTTKTSQVIIQIFLYEAEASWEKHPYESVEKHQYNVHSAFYGSFYGCCKYVTDAPRKDDLLPTSQARCRAQEGTRWSLPPS